MIDITHKSTTLRMARAVATLVASDAATIEAVRNNTVPKGNVLEAARVAGLLGVKQTANLIPDCHPMPIEHTEVSYNFDGLQIHIEMLVHTIYKTGVEVEAMHGVSVVALTMYDMLKPIDKGIEITGIKLLEKKGGKSNFKKQYEGLKAAVVVCSDSISAGEKEDKAGKAIIAKLEQCGVAIADYTIIPDEAAVIAEQVNTNVSGDADLLIFTGGTGLSPRDVTSETVRPMLEREMPGVEEAIRKYGQDRMPYAMLSRSVAGTIGKTMILALPGSTAGARESMDAVFPHVLHAFWILNSGGH